MKWFAVFICILTGLMLGEQMVNCWNYYNDISVTATTLDGHRCLTVFNPEPTMACYKIED
ncbi:hypothetical protein VP199E371_P0034 [Vibrio phage 199E37-1]|nr:hypothetical protein VP199E371_P0034 [Vibrio phage 199E37-1]